MTSQVTSCERVIELAQKLHCKENRYCVERMPEWIEKSIAYADMMVDKYGFNKVQRSHEGYRLLYILNHLCPNLHHFWQKPKFRVISEYDMVEYNKLLQYHIMENSQASFADESGNIIQEGVTYTTAEFNKFIETVNKILN